MHLERLLFAMVAVTLVGVLYQRFTGPDPSAPVVEAAAPARTLEQSVAELEARAADTPDEPAVWQQLAQLYVQRAAQTLDPSFFNRAEAAAAKATALAPDAGPTLAANAAVAASLHHFDDARTAALRAVEIDPYDSAAQAVLVDAEIELGRYDDAERSLQTFAARKPGAPVLSRISYFRELHGDGAGARQAMAEARQAVAGAGAFQQATLAAYDGDLLWAQGDLDGAAAAYDDALALEPAHPIATVGHAKLLAANGDRDEAIDLLSTFVERTPVPAAATLLGELQQLDGRTDDADQSFALVRALAKLQADVGVDVDLDLALFEADHSTPAPELVDRARAAYADRPTVYGADALAWTLYRAGDVGGAQQTLVASLATGSDDPLLHFHAAAILDSAGDQEGARTHLQAVADTNPWFSAGLQPEAQALAGRLGMAWPAGDAS